MAKTEEDGYRNSNSHVSTEPGQLQAVFRVALALAVDRNHLANRRQNRRAPLREVRKTRYRALSVQSVASVQVGKSC